MNHIKNISIPAPCHQSWQQMTPGGQGRHCLHCSKTVTDFSKMTEDQIIGYLANHAGTCGRFSEHQLTTINRHLAVENTTGASHWKKWVVAAGVFGAAIVNRATAQTTPAVPVVTQQNPVAATKNTLQLMGKVAVVDSTKIFGRVIATDDKLPIPGVLISIKGTSIGTLSDNDGCFELTVPRKKQVLVAQCIGYNKQEVSVKPASGQPLSISLALSSEAMGEIVVTKGTSQSRVEMFYQYMPWPINRLFK